MRASKPYIDIARPKQYLKNGFVWLPLFFGYKLHDTQAIGRTFLAFAAFCLAASSVYVLNDLRDVEADRIHPVKKLRPLASGALAPRNAVVFMAALLLLALTVSLLLPARSFLPILGAYLAINMAYSFFLKHYAIIDLVCIAIGFVLRVFAGGVSAGVRISHWLVLITFLLALFLALAKRRDDLLLAAEGSKTRKSVESYNLEFVSLVMAIMAAVIIVAYILYTVSPEIVQKHGTDQLYLTAFWVILGILRYMQITFVEERSGSPTQVLLTDGFLQAVIVLWGLTFYLLLYAFGS